jgi:hypothetical protein
MAPATAEQVSRLKRQVESLKKELDELQPEKKTALVSAAAPSAAPHTTKWDVLKFSCPFYSIKFLG